MVQGYPSQGSGNVFVRTSVRVGVGLAEIGRTATTGRSGYRIRILLNLRVSNGLNLRQGGLSYFIIYQRECMEEAKISRKKECKDSVVRISALAAEVSELNKRGGELTEMLKVGSQNASEMASWVWGGRVAGTVQGKGQGDSGTEVKAGHKDRFGRKSQKGTKGRDDEPAHAAY